MRIFKVAQIVSCIVLMMTVCVYAGPGSDSAEYLNVDVGARAVAMGGTQFGAVNDGFSSRYNPALFSGIRRREVGFMHNEYFADIRQEFLTYVQPSQYGNWNLGVNYFGYGKIRRYDNSKNYQGDFSADDVEVNGSWSKEWSLWEKDTLSSGLSVKYLRRNLGDDKAQGVAFDFGVGTVLTWKYVEGVQIAASIQNVGPAIKMIEEKNALPMKWRVGMARSFFEKSITLAADLVSQDTQNTLCGGVEFRPFKLISVRGGYKNHKDLQQSISVGIGFELSFLRLDYAFVPFENLGNTHRISILLPFGKDYK